MSLHPELPTTDTPLEMLVACHGRVRKFTDTLVRLADHLATHGPDDQARQAATAILRYFEQAAPRHHADEEEDLFPALLQAAGDRPDCTGLRDTVAALTREHEELDAEWQSVRQQLRAVVEGKAADLHADDRARRFAQHYQQHAQREESDVYPWAATLLSGDDMARIADAMTQRRRD